MKIVVAEEIIEQLVKEFCYLGSMRCHREIKRRIATAASIWFEIWGSWIRVKKNSISTGKFPKNFNFFRQFYKRISSFAGKFPKILIFSGNKKIRFSKQKIVHLQLPLGKIILFLFKSNHFRTYFLYMIRYNNISRPVHDSNDPPATLLATPLPKIGGRDPQPPGLTPLNSYGKEAFSRRKELPRGRLRRMKMPQEKNGENTDLKCDLVLCGNKDYEKGGHHKIGSL